MFSWAEGFCIAEEAAPVFFKRKPASKMEEIKKELQKHALVLELILEVLETWAETEGVSLISSQQLHSPTAERNEKVRVLIQEIRKLG